MIKKVLLSIPSAIFYLLFGITLVLCHALQWLCLKVGGYKWHKWSVDVLYIGIMTSLLAVGNRFSVVRKTKLPMGRPLIVISNHQSMYDIVAIGWFLRKQHPKYVSKVELGKGIPSVSFNLRHGGSVLIDRKNSRQSLPALAKFGKSIFENKRAAVIFPEGTRSKNGKPKAFNTTGLKILLKAMPDALVVPVTVNNSWKLQRYGAFPIDMFINLKLTVHEPIKASSLSAEELLAKAEKTITENIL